MRTFHHLSTGSAGYKACIPSPVQKQDRLLSFVQPVRHKLLQFSAENGPVALLQFLSEIYGIHGGQFSACQPLCQLKQAVLTLSCPVICFQRGCGGSQYHAGVIQPCHLQRRFPGMVLWRAFTLIAVLLFLIHDDQSQIGKRCEKSRSGTYDHIDLSGLGTFTLIILFPRRQGGIHHADPVSEPLVKPKQRLIRQCDLRDQYDGLPPSFYHLPDQLHIHFRFSASGNPVDQIRLSVSGVKIFQYLRDNSFLLFT